MEIYLEPISATTIAVVVLTGLFGYLIGRLQSQKKRHSLDKEISALKAVLELEQEKAEERQATLQLAQQQLSDTFNKLSRQALDQNSNTFLNLAQEKLKQHHQIASSDLEQRQQSIQNLVKPIHEAMQKTEHQIREIEKDRKQAYGALHKHLESMALMQENLTGETRNLVQALRRPEIRGQWGEITLKRVVELAGMVEHCDFYEQKTVQSDGAVRRPDMVVRMPEARDIVVDVKTPLDAYLSAVAAENEQERARELIRHAKNLRTQIKDLSSKAYWNQFDQAPDFVVLFVPGDQFLSAALEQDHNLLEEALRQQVILATPTSLVALLRAVAYGWRQEQMTKNAKLIRELGQQLYQRLSTFTDHLSRVGKGLGSAVETYNKAVGSLERQVLPGARKMQELGLESKKDLGEAAPIEEPIRSVQQIDSEPSD